MNFHSLSGQSPDISFSVYAHFLICLLPVYFRNTRHGTWCQRDFYNIYLCPKNCWHSSCASSFYPIKKNFFSVKSRSLSSVFLLTFSEKVRCRFPPDIYLIDMIDSLFCPCHDTFTWCMQRFICETGWCR